MGDVLLIAATRRRSAVSSEETVGALDEVVASTGGAAQCSDSIQQLAPVPERRDAKLFKVLRCQARKDRLVYLILAECRRQTSRGPGSAARRQFP